MTSETEAAQAPEVRTEGALVVLRAPACALTPEAAEALAEQLCAAAEEARRASVPAEGERRRPPFPPAELVSPHGAS
jgi:hypothetical protein